MKDVHGELALLLQPGMIVKFRRSTTGMEEEGTLADFFLNKTVANEVFIRVIVGIEMVPVLGKDIVAIGW